MNKKLVSHLSLLISILIIASFLRLYNITELPPGLYPDEAMNGNNAMEALSINGHFKWFYPENNGREGLFINIQALSLALFGNFPWALRIVSAIFGILTVLGLYFCAKELFNNINEKIKNNIALLSSFFLATSFWHINFSRIGFRAIMAPFFLVWALYFFLLSLRKTALQRQIMFKKSEIIDSKLETNSKFSNSKFKTFISSFGFHASGLAILAGLLYGLGFHSYIAYRATPLLILIIVLLYWLKNKEWQIRKKNFISIFLFFIFVIIAAAPLILYFSQNPQDFFGRTAQISIFNSHTPLKDLGINILKTAGMFNFSGDYNWRHNYAGKPQLFWPVGILFLIGAFFAINSLIQNLKFKNQNGDSKFKIDSPTTNAKNLRFAFCILISWLIISAIPVIISNEGLPHALRAIIMIPPIFILAGVGGAWLISKIMNYGLKIKNNSRWNLKFLKFIINALLFIILSLFIFESYSVYFIKWGRNFNTQNAFSADYVKIGQELNSLPKKTPKYVIVQAGGVNVRGIPMPTQTVMFITDTFTQEKQKEKNIFYVLPDQINQIPENSHKIILK